MKVAIMQPYFLPYLGYFQLMNYVDVFVVYDNIEFTKKGWIHRNRILVNDTPQYITLPLKKGPDTNHVCDRYLADTFSYRDATKMLNRIKGAYGKSPHFDTIYPVIENILHYDGENLFDFIYHSLLEVRKVLGIDTKIIKSSDITIDHSLKGKEKVIAIVQALGGDEYINPIGGVALYDVDEFLAHDIELTFLKMSDTIQYRQTANTYHPFLSILDTLMAVSDNTMKTLLTQYELQK